MLPVKTSRDRNFSRDYMGTDAGVLFEDELNLV